jgi:murein DD-endopeptidase MepM/ murein hydrolase activator NlpD
MRAALTALLLLAAGAILVPSSGADTPARANAQAAAVGGSLGDYGALDAAGDGEETDDAIAVDEDGIAVGKAEVVARASRAGGVGTARAAALARHVNLFDGLVTAKVARRTATAADGATARAGRVAGLVVEGRPIGDVRQPRAYPLSDGGTVTVNQGTAALQVTLGAARGSAPAGTEVRIAIADATARDAVVTTPTPTPTPTPTATPTAKPAKQKAKPKRRKAPKVPQRLTRQRYAFPVFGKATVADDFGAPRAAVGKHQGNDVFAPFGAPVLAVADGTVRRVGTLPISGNRLWLHTTAGDAFFYGHLSAFSPDAVNGRRVKAGTVLGFTGNTGDAEPTPPHVHFEIHPGGEEEDAIDPHAILLAWQEHRDVPPGAWLTRHGADTAERPGALVEVRDFIADK